MKVLSIVLAFAALFPVTSFSAERVPIPAIQTDVMARETQFSPDESGPSHMSMLWWIPVEFWQAILSRNANADEAQNAAMLSALGGVSLLAVVQADLSELGTFSFYTREQVAGKMKITYTDSSGKTQELKPLSSVDPNLEIVLGVFKPILAGAMGNMGSNMHFYVLSDADSKGKRLIDPYRRGILSVTLGRSDGAALHSALEMPVNSLYVPRKCPNGKPAHILWKYCPWNGEKLPD